MSWATIVATIKTRLEAAAGIAGGAGVVWDHRPLVTQPDDYETKFKGTSVINAWLIEREGGRDLQTGDGYRFIESHDVLISGYYAVDEAGGSIATFEAIIDDIKEKIRGDLTIWTIQPESGPIDVRFVGDHDSLGDVLCHACEMRFTVDEVKEIT